MFCPKCGEPLEEVNGELTCRKGNMGLSAYVAEGLRACFIEKTRNPSDKQLTYKVGGRWFCPGCGVQMVEHAGLIQCPKCSRCLSEFLYPLVERHPHD
jgi:ribosomal protein S27AE